MDTKFYNDLKIGQTILNEMLERKLVSPFIYEGLKDVSDTMILQEAKKGFERIDDNFFNWSGVKYSLEQFDRLYHDPNIRTIKQFADKIGWPPTSGDMDNNNKAWTATFQRFAVMLNQEYNKNYEKSFKQRTKKLIGQRATKSSLGGMRATGNPPDRYLQPGQAGQKNRQIEAINAEDLLPGVFYTDITRIPRSNHAKFWKFWDRQISSVPTEKTGLLGRKWEKSFIFGFELAGTKGFGYEIWYNSIDSTFTLYDSRANDVTNERYDTLQGATRALFNAVTTDSRADLDYRIATSPTAQSMFKAVSSNIDPMIQRFQQMETKDQKEFNRKLETVMKDWTNDEKERFKEEYTPVRFSNNSIMDAAERYTAAFNTLKEHLPETQKDIRDLAFTGTIDSFEKEVKEAVKNYAEYSPAPASSPDRAPARASAQERREVKERGEKAPLEGDVRYLDPQEQRRREDEKIRKENNRKREKPTFIDRAKKASKELENETRWREEEWGKGELDPTVRKQTPQEIKQNRERQFRMIAMYRPKWTDDPVMLAMRDTLTKTSVGYEKLFVDLAKHIIITYYGLDPQHSYVKELDALYNKRMSNNKKPEWDRVTGGPEGTFETEELFVKRIIEILEKAKREQVISKTGKAAAYVGDSVDDDLKLFMDARVEAVQQLEELDMLSPDQRDYVTDLNKNHNFSIVNNIRKTAEKETANQRQIQMFVNQNLLKVYHQSKIKRSDMMGWWESQIKRSGTLARWFGDANILTPHMLQKQRGWDASFISGFSLKEHVNFEIWYVTEPNPDHKSRHKTISSFYVFDATALKLIEKHIPHLRHAQSVIAQKIGLLERTI